MEGLPRYRSIYETLRKKINEGRYAPGDLLPSENELCAKYGVTRPTVRKALDILTDESLIIRHQGKGSIVRGTPRGIGILSLMSTTSAMHGTELRTDIIIKPERRLWNEAFTYPLGEVEKEAGCIYFERVRILDGEPVIFDITMLPDVGIARFIENDMKDASLYDLLRSKYQITVTGGVQQLFAIGADRRLKSHLHVRQGYPVLQVNRRMDTNREGFRVYNQIFCVTTKYGLSGIF